MGTEQQAPCMDRRLSDSTSSDDTEDGPLHWSGIHDQLEALLQQVEDPVAQDADTTQCPNSPSAEAAPAAAEELANDTGSAGPACAGASQGTAAPVPEWLTGIHAAGAPLQADSQETPAAKISSSRAFLGGSPPGTGLQSYSCRRSVPEWLVSPLRGSRLAGELSPIKRLIAEIDAHLAADEARKASAAFFGGDAAVHLGAAERLDGKTWFSNPEYAAAAAPLAAGQEEGAHAQSGLALEAIAEDDWAASSADAADSLPSASNQTLESLIRDAAGSAGLKADPVPASPLSSCGGCTAESATRQQLFQDLAVPGFEPTAGLTLGSCGSSPVHVGRRCPPLHAAQEADAAAAVTQGGDALWQVAEMEAKAWEDAATAEARTASAEKDAAAVTAAVVPSPVCLGEDHKSPDAAPRVRILRRSVSPQQVVGERLTAAKGSPAPAAEDEAACKLLPIDVSFNAASADPDKENTPSPGAEDAGSRPAARSSSGQRSALGELHASSPHADAAELPEREELQQLPSIEASPSSTLVCTN